MSSFDVLCIWIFVIVGQTQLWGYFKFETAASAPWRMKTQRASCENTQLLLAVHRHHRQRRTLCMLVCVMISISLPGVHFLHVRHRCGWVVVVSSLSLTLTSLISCLPSQALSRSLPPGSQPLAVYHKITCSYLVHIAIKSRVFEITKCALKIRKFYSWRNQ